MAKMTKRQLKSIVKECLLELLAEGLDNNVDSVSLKKEQSFDRQERIRLEEDRLRQHRQKFETRVDDAVTNVTTDPIMQSILADTAKTTLQEQMQHAGPNATSGPLVEAGASLGGSGISLNDIFSGPKQNWADLAFNEIKSS